MMIVELKNITEINYMCIFAIGNVVDDKHFCMKICFPGLHLTGVKLKSIIKKSSHTFKLNSLPVMTDSSV